MGIFDLESREALIGTPTVSVNPNATGNVLERLAYITGNLGNSRPMLSVALSLGIPPPSSDPVDRTITETTTFEDFPVHYYRNLTIAPGVNVRLRNGPMIIVVEGDLTIGEGALVDGDGLGGKGGESVSGGAHGKGGYGGNLWRFYMFSLSADPELLSHYSLEGALAGHLFNPNGVLSGTTPDVTAANGVAWIDPYLAATLTDAGFLWLFYKSLVYAILHRQTYHSTYGGLGGGGGGSGASSTRTNSINISLYGGGTYGGKGEDGKTSSKPGAGGAGFGGGGSGGFNFSGQSDGTSGAGGNGGGTQLWIVRRLSNAGIIRSNGQNGGNATGAAGGGGGGGGGCAALLYQEPFGAGVGIWQANGGEGGIGSGGAQNGGNGGAGLVKLVQYMVKPA